MNNTYGTNKPGYDKIALLGLFILSLLTAHFIVVFKSRISFSDPILLSKTGLSVSIPAGQAWQSDREWKFQENMFSLSSLFPRGSDRPTAWVNCRYLLSVETTTPQMRFEQIASEIKDAVITDRNQMQTDTLTIDWARIDKGDVHFSMFFGTVRLPDNRQLDIEVSQIAGDGELAELVFKYIIENVIFEDNRLLNTGKIIPAHIDDTEVAKDLTADEDDAYAFIPKLPDKQGFPEHTELIAPNNQMLK